MEDWIDATEEQAYMIGVSVEEYGRLQPHELRKIFNAYSKKQQNRDYRTAYFLSWLVNCQVTEAVSPADIADPLYITKEEKERRAAEDKKVLFDEFNLNEDGGK